MVDLKFYLKYIQQIENYTSLRKVRKDKSHKRVHNIMQFTGLWAHLRNEDHGGVGCLKFKRSPYDLPLWKIWEPFDHGS